MARKEIRHRNRTFPIAYEIRNPSAEKDLVILHGWGSNKEIMRGAFGDTLPSFRHIYIDLPGFGKSPTDAVLTTTDYAEIVTRFLEALGAEAKVVAGHSFGGKVATLMAPQMLILLSSAGIPVPKPLGVRVKIGLFKLLKTTGLGGLRRYFASADARQMPQNMYETFKNVVDEDFSAIFSRFEGKALLFWGKADTATPLWTGERIASLIPKSRLVALEGDHFFFTRHAMEIARTIEEEYHATF